MAEEQKQHETETYDFTKNITDIEVSPAFIIGLQRICNQLIVSKPERGAEMPAIFKKFEKIVHYYGNKDEYEEEPVVELDVFESDIYTLFSLIQLFKHKAKEQGLQVLTETNVTKVEMQELAKIVEAGGDATEKIRELNAKMTVVK
tara:strand:- start:314 stop:751 length:438 start_codon:yes stop_codon:yes gene_type:complete